MYTSTDVKQLSMQSSPFISEMILAKKSIQNSVLNFVSQEERVALMRNLLPASLVVKTKNAGKNYLRGLSGTDVEVFCVAMAVGTIIKEFDNGNTAHVAFSELANIMNFIKG